MGPGRTKLKVAVIEISGHKRTSSDIGSQAAKEMLQWMQGKMEISCKDCMWNKEFNAQDYLGNKSGMPEPVGGSKCYNWKGTDSISSSWVLEIKTQWRPVVRIW